MFIVFVGTTVYNMLMDANKSDSTEEQPANLKQEGANWEFHAEDSSATSEDNGLAHTLTTNVEPVSWTASEFIYNQKTTGWYVALGVVTVLVGAGIYFVTRDYITLGMIGVAGILFGVIASRKPRELEYRIDDTGIHIGEKLYPFSGFKSFSLMQESGIESIWLMPLKRFMPSISLYFAPEDKDKIVDSLSGALPVQPRELDPLDKLIHKIGF